MRCVNRQKPNVLGRRVRGFANAPPAQHPRLCPAPCRETPPRHWLETLRVLMGKLRPREEAMSVVLRDIHCESTAEAGLELGSSPGFQSRAFDTPSYSRGKVDRKMGFHLVVSFSSRLSISAGSFSSPHCFPGRAYPVL